jgi:antitoxin YefM
MLTTYRLKASELDQKFLDELKSTYGDREIEISVADLTTQLEAMANDPSIQSEIQQIEQEFKITEMDGLANL